MQTIDEKYIREFDLDNPAEFSKIIEEKGSSTFKILKITSVTGKSALKFVLKGFIEFLNESSHLFLISICADDISGITLEDLKPLEDSIHPQKPLIIQWESADASNRYIFYKQPHSPLLSLDTNWPVNFTVQELEIELVTFKLPLLLKALYFNFGGLYNGNLLMTRLNAIWEFDSWQLIDYAAKSDDALSLRYLLLFQWDLVKEKEYEDRALEIAAQYASPLSLRALLDLPTNDTIEELLPVCEARRLLNLKSRLKLTPLSIAAKYCKIETLKLIINCGIKEDYEKVINEAWEYQSYEVVLVLLQSGSPFPARFKLPRLSDDPHIAALINLVAEREEFHKAIRERSYEIIENFVKRYPHLKQAQTEDNHTALETALAAKRWDVYGFLLSKGFAIGSTEELKLQKLSLTDTMELKTATSQFFRKQDNSHIAHLLSKVRCLQGNMTMIKELLEDLNEMPYVFTILKVLEKSNIQEIVFDFNKKSIVDVHPSGTSAANGECDFIRGILYIGANENRKALLGTLAHELCHLAMQTVYKHMCNPYIEVDVELASCFKEIIELYREKKQINPIIKTVFSETYDEIMRPSELIVRVPHIIACHYSQIQNNDVGSRRSASAIEPNPAVICEAPELFEFYRKNVQKDFNGFISDSLYFETQHLNIALKHVSKILKSNIQINNSLDLDENILSENVTIVCSSTPELVKIELFQIFKQKYFCIPAILSHCMFVELDDLKTEHYILWISRCFKSNYKQTLIVDCSRCDLEWHTLYNEVFSYVKQGQARIIFITNTVEANDKHKYLHKDIYQYFYPEKVREPLIKEYIFSDIKAECRENILQKATIDFQGYSIALNRLISPNSVNIELLPLANLLLQEAIHIGEHLTGPYVGSNTYYIERTLRVKIKKNKKASFGEAEFLKFHSKKMVLLSGEAGIGKSFVLAHLAQEFKKLYTDHWVMKFNLHEHTESLKNIKETREHIEDTAEFIMDKLLKLKEPLEIRIFKELLKQKKLIIMLDGFDEISPTYTDVVIELVKNLKLSVTGQLWLTSRNYHESFLKEELEPLLCNLQQFSGKDVICFLEKFWSQNINLTEDEVGRKRITLFAKQLLNSLPNAINNTKDVFIGIPLHVRMLAEICEKKVKAYLRDEQEYPLLCELDFSDIYNQFMYNKFKLYRKEKVCAVNIHQHNLQQVHEELAIKYLFPEDEKDLVSLTKFEKINKLSDEELDRIGLTLHSGDSFAFIHRSFAEYFAASFFVRKIVDSNSQSIFTFFIEKIICNIENEVMRTFIDSFLDLPDSAIDSTKYKLFGAIIANIWKGSDKRRIKLLYTHNYKLTQLILNSLVEENDKALLEEIYYHRGSFLVRFEILEKNKQWFYEIPWFEAAINGNMDTLKLLWDKYHLVGRSKLIRLLTCKSNLCDSIFFISIQGNKVELFDLLITFVKDICLTKKKFKEIFLFWTRYWWCRDTGSWARHLSPSGVAEQSWVFDRIGKLVEYLKFAPTDYEELLDMVCTYTYRNDVDFAIVQYGAIWHIAAYTGNINTLEELVKWISKTYLKTTDLIELLNARAWKGETVWHCALNKVANWGVNWENLSVWVRRGTASSQEVVTKLYAWFWSLGVDTNTLNEMLCKTNCDEYLDISRQALEYAETCNLCRYLQKNRRKRLKNHKTCRKIKWSLY